MKTLILASQSPYRKMQLREMGLKFLARRPTVEEEALKKKFTISERRRGRRPDLGRLAKYLALQKANSIARGQPSAVVIGGDQLLALATGSKTVRLDKPGTPARAQQQLRKLSGRTHYLITAIAVVGPGRRPLVFKVVARIRMRKLTTHEIKAYLARDKPFDCAGSYRLEKAGLTLIERISVSDPSALVGLPKMKLAQALRAWGLS
jgi:septum formation protein